MRSMLTSSAQVLDDVIAIDVEIDVWHLVAAGVEADILQELLKNRKQAARADVLLGFVEHIGRVSDGVDGAVLEGKKDLVHGKKRLVLTGQRIFGLGQDGLKVLLRKALKRHMHGEAALQLRTQVRHLGHMKRARRDKA